MYRLTIPKHLYAFDLDLPGDSGMVKNLVSPEEKAEYGWVTTAGAQTSKGFWELMNFPSIEQIHDRLTDTFALNFTYKNKTYKSFWK